MYDNTELTLDDYILYIREKNGGTITAWRLGNGLWNQGYGITLNNNNFGTYKDADFGQSHKHISNYKFL